MRRARPALRVRAASREATPPRFYQLILQQDLLGGWSLVRQYGRTGMAGTQKRQHFESLDQAQAAFDRLRQQQLEQGFKVTFVEGHAGKDP